MINVAVADTTETEETSPPGAAETETKPAELNFHPLGAIKVNVTLVPTEKSAKAPSVMTIFPRAVKEGTVAFSALSAEINVPPDALVIVTVAFALNVKSSVDVKIINKQN